MSRKQNPVTLLGPDGLPLDRAKYAPKPEPKVTVGVDMAAATLDETRIWGISTATRGYGSIYQRIRDLYLYDGPAGLSVGHASTAVRKPRALADRVADDLRALGIDPTATEPELPRAPADLTAYADAYDAAVRLCPHEEVEDTIHSRGEYQCVACGRYLSRDDMRRRRGSGPFGWMFGR